MNDTSSGETPTGGRWRPVAELLVSLQFLTRLPIPFARTIDPQPLALAMRCFGLAGAVIGALNGAVLIGLSNLHLPPLMVAALTIGFGLFVTGALHEDGLADTFDGLFGGREREKRLEIMRDSRIGTYGASALGVLFLLRAGAFQALLGQSPLQIILIMAAAAAFSRAMVVDMLWATRHARNDGLSVLAGRPDRITALLAIVTAGALVVWAGLGVSPASGILALGIALAITGFMRRLATKLIGGQTGDICGAAQVLSEIGMLAVFVSMLH
jgi:adenosylcobinamide-GDP ribazoletransferase